MRRVEANAGAGRRVGALGVAGRRATGKVRKERRYREKDLWIEIKPSRTMKRLMRIRDVELILFIHKAELMSVIHVLSVKAQLN